MIRLFARRLDAYEVSGRWWVVIEPLRLTDEARVRWKWSIRPITMRLPSNLPVPSATVIEHGYAYTKSDARAAAFKATRRH